MTPRRLGAAAVLYAVFVGGWHLGQPLPHVGCQEPEPVTASKASITGGEPGDVIGDFARTATAVETLATQQIIEIDSIVECGPAPRPRLVAWLTGDWR